MMNVKRFFVPLLFYALLIFATVLTGEIALQIAAQIWQKADILTRPDCDDPFINDAQGAMSNGRPFCLDHDSRGYRNRTALNQADIVALGDSFTYGTSILDAAWPSVLSARLKKQVYNMGLPGTGPLLSLQHLPQALQLHPQIVIFGFYFGNDLYDDFTFAKAHGMLSKLIPQSTIAEITKADQVQSLEAKIDVLLRGALESKTTDVGKVRNFLAQNSRLYSFLRKVKNNFFPDAIKARLTRILEPRYEDAVAGIQESQRPYVAPFSENGWKTILTAPYRLGAVDLSDVRIRAGLEIVKYSLVTMNKICADNHVRFIVALFPTKEFVFHAKVHDVSKYNSYKSAVEYEEIIKQQLLSVFKENHIDFVDPTNLLQNAESQTYYESADGHPNVVGHRIISTAIENHLKDLGFGAARAD
jgi:hypothetical protein